MLTRLFTALAALGLTLALAGCQTQTGTAPKDQAKLYDVKGKVVAVDPTKQTVTLDHEDIPGLMKAMRMEFKVADPKLLDGLAAGDSVQGKLKVQSGDDTLTELTKR
jgi:Cu/Ag efflux protein CusF